jgi:molecular chaperone GrpE (heat shock protein)
MTKPSLSKRLAAAWQSLTGAATAPPSVAGPSAADDARLAAESAAAALRLEVEEARQQIAALRRELDAERAGRADAVQAAVASQMEPALADAASFIGQLALQASLIEQGKPVAARDVMALARNLSRAFEKLGLVPLAAVGDTAVFNPGLHQPLGTSSPAAGSPVVVKIPGSRLDGKIVRKSLVEPSTLNSQPSTVS